MLQLVTDHPIAIDSDDHKHPEGVFYDNNLNIDFVNSVENYFKNKDQIYFMDQGCAGGALAVEFFKRGHKSIGLEGSDQILNPSEELLKEKTKNPEGHENWKQYFNQILFTCDLTKEYKILEDNNTVQFDLITSWDVMEHFNEEDVDNVLSLTYKHLKSGGMFIANIALFQSGRMHHPECKYEILYHKTVKDSNWWEHKLSKYFSKIDYPFSCTNRQVNHSHFLYAGKKI